MAAKDLNEPFMKQHLIALGVATGTGAAATVSEMQVWDLRLRIACSVVALVVGIPSAIVYIIHLWQNARKWWKTGKGFSD